MSDQSVNSSAKPTVRAIAFYLPQFHPVPENDTWWGKGFTEWTNVAKAKPLYRGHYQPHLPADLGFYDLRVPEVRELQAQMARECGIEAFCYWHYWFAGRRILERPFAEVLASGKPDFPFCLAWANETWSGIWHGESKRILIEQTYPGQDDYRKHFEFLLTAFRDPRYVRVNGKPLLFIYKAELVPDCLNAMNLFRRFAAEAGLPGLHLVGFAPDPAWDGKAHGFDAITLQTMAGLPSAPVYGWGPKLRRAANGTIGLRRLSRMIYSGPMNVFRYQDVMDRLIVKPQTNTEYYPCVIPNWDNTPRSSNRGWVLHGSTPELFGRHLQQAIEQVEALPEQHRIVFIKAWNEWAEGNYLEPDQKFGHGYLQAAREALFPSGQQGRKQSM
jgi:lipopolysaccharide biosynthesis protein